jgi:hypothetical protein
MHVVPIFRRERFLGTGLVVGPGRVLTCSHVVRPDPTAPLDQPDDPAEDLLAGGAPVEAVWADNVLDLALLAVAAVPQVEEPLFLLRPPRGSPLIAVGFQPDPRGVSLDRTRQFSIVQEQFSDGQLVGLQIPGGIPHGFSGGPVVVEVGRQQLVVGLTQLGGAERASSRLLATHRIAGFLKQHGIEARVRERISWNQLLALFATQRRFQAAATAVVAALVLAFSWPRSSRLVGRVIVLPDRSLAGIAVTASGRTVHTDKDGAFSLKVPVGAGERLHVQIDEASGYLLWWAQPEGTAVDDKNQECITNRHCKLVVGAKS